MQINTPGQSNTVVCAILVKMTLKKIEMADYSARFHEKFMLKKSTVIVRFKRLWTTSVSSPFFFFFKKVEILISLEVIPM